MRTKTMTVVTLLSLILAGTVFAQPLPSLKILVPANPGGGWDQTARVIEQALRAEKLVTGAMRLTNRGGAGGTIGLAEFAKSKGEGGSLMVMGLVMVGAILTNKSPVTLESVTPIARLTSEYLVIAEPESSKIRTLRDFTEALKKDPRAVPNAGGSRGVVAPEGIGAADRKALLDTSDIMVKSASWKAELRKQKWEDAYLAGDAYTRFIRAENERI